MAELEQDPVTGSLYSVYYRLTAKWKHCHLNPITLKIAIELKQQVMYAKDCTQEEAVNRAAELMPPGATIRCETIRRKVAE